MTDDNTALWKLCTLTSCESRLVLIQRQRQADVTYIADRSLSIQHVTCFVVFTTVSTFTDHDRRPNTQYFSTCMQILRSIQKYLIKPLQTIHPSVVDTITDPHQFNIHVLSVLQSVVLTTKSHHT